MADTAVDTKPTTHKHHHHHDKHKVAAAAVVRTATEKPAASDEITEEQKQAAIAIAKGAITELTKKQADIEGDDTGYSVLLGAAESGNPSPGDEGDNKADTAGDTEGDKKEGDTDGADGLTKVWENFKKGAREIGTWASDFVKQLENAPLQEQTKKDVAAVCRQYKVLLEKTSGKLQAYRKDVRRMFNLFDDVLSLLVPDPETRTDLDSLPSDDAKLKKVSEFAKENKDGLQAALLALSTGLQDNTSKDSILALQAEWTDMTKSIENILAEVDEDVRAFRKKMSIIIGVGFVFAAVLGAVAIFFTGGAALAAIAPLVGTMGAWAVAGLAALTVVGLAVFGAALIAEPEIARSLKLTQEGVANAINSGLQHIASQADNLETILHFIYKDWCEVQGNDPSKDLKFQFGKAKVDRLIQTMIQTKLQLHRLESDIMQTENVVDEELRNYGEKVYKPLLKMYN